MTVREDKRFAVLIAAHNEEDRVCDTVVASLLLPGVVGVIVADDGSRDGTAQAAGDAGALVISNQTNRGKGAAMESAAAALENLKPFGELTGVLLLDADVGKSAAGAADLLEPLLDGTADMVIGILPAPPGKAGFGWTKSLAREGIEVFGGGFKAEAPLSGQRALTLECLSKIRPFAEAFAMEVDMTIRALQQELRVVEVPITMEHRHTGRNLKGFIHRGKQYNDINRLLNSYYKKRKLRPEKGNGRS